MKKNKNSVIVYSTDPNWIPEKSTSQISTLPPEKQNLSIELIRLKGNKICTLITQFVGTEEDLNTLCKNLKQLCSVGGTAKNGHIQLQGDVRVKVEQYFTKHGYKYKYKH
ncbi:MAG: translation initiation factor [Bacteroidia bacterium]|nr:translation initiation factor [Bacteroidia bacterium]MDW8347735.1 translation initiation factor [Bacteroidia bacterium]